MEKLDQRIFFVRYSGKTFSWLEMLGGTQVVQIRHQVALPVSRLHTYQQLLIALEESNGARAKIVEAKLSETISEIAHHRIVTIGTQEEDPYTFLTRQITQANHGTIDNLVIIRP